MARAACAALQEWMFSEDTERCRLNDIRSTSDRFVEVSEDTTAVQFRHPGNGITALQVLLLLLFTLASIVNGLFFLQESGLTDNVFNALCISAIVSLAPVILSHWALTGLTSLSRHRIERRLKAVALPTSGVGLALFAITFGGMLEVSNPFEEESSFRPPLWVLVAVSMGLEALVSIAVFTAIETRVHGLLPTRPRETAIYDVSTNRLGNCKHLFAESVALRIRLEGVLAQLGAERERFVKDAVYTFAVQRLAIQAQIAAETAMFKKQSLAALIVVPHERP